MSENPYLQYFIGLRKYSNKAPFDASMLVHFRDRLDINLVNKMNKDIFGGKSEEDREEVEVEKKS